jgi:DNA-binding XRE family transcriptional regulator
MTGDCLCLNLGIECWCPRPGPGGFGYAAHGTPAGARRHYRRDGRGWRCEPCREAERRDWRDRKPWSGRIRKTSPSMTEAGRQVREMRQAAGMTQRALGAALGVAQSNVSAWERGAHGSGPDLLERVAAVTGADGLERAA